MMCPVCKRELAPTLSICLTCGAMMNDTVREELETKVTCNSGGLVQKHPIIEPPRPGSPIERPPLAAERPKAAAPSKPLTRELPNKQTSPTLVEFQNKNATLPDWRLQLQNAVRQRGSSSADICVAERPAAPAANGRAATVRAAALKLEIETDPDALENSNPRLASAIRRIERSRSSFLPAEAKQKAAREPAARKFPFEVVTPKDDAAAAAKSAPHIAVAKPKLVTAFKIEKKAYDTNKLPRLPEKTSPVEPAKLVETEEIPIEPLKEAAGILENTDPIEEGRRENEIEEYQEVEGIDDLAPFSMRFGAGLFDAIISGFATLIILSPFMLGGGTWLSLSGALTMVAAIAIFMFLYATACLAVWGRTFGMRIFSLELIDAEANAYPTVHQAAVSSAVYLLSMAFAGAGFLTIFFNEEKRAIHDIVSGTLLIREI